MLQSVASQPQWAVGHVSPAIELLPWLVKISDASYFYLIGIYVNLFQVDHFSPLAIPTSDCLTQLLVFRGPFFLLGLFYRVLNTILINFSCTFLIK